MRAIRATDAGWVTVIVIPTIGGGQRATDVRARPVADCEPVRSAVLESGM